MADTTRELRLAAALVESAQTLHDGFDPVRYLHRLADRCVELLGADGAGVSVLDQEGRTTPAAHSTREHDAVRELLAAGRLAGPARDSLDTGRPVPPVPLASARAAARWPDFTAAARGHGIGAVYAVPLRRGERLLGALSVFSPEVAAEGEELAIAQALADGAALGLLNHHAYAQYRGLSGQLQGALASRVRIEQAKGMLAERWATSPDSAFPALRQYARSNRLPLQQVAQDVIHRALTDAELPPGRYGPA